VNLSTGEIGIEPLREEVVKSFLGGGGYAVRYLYDFVDENTDPLGPENPLFFMTGPLTGTIAPGTGRWVVCAKSPLTKLWGESNCGGYFGAEIKFSGFDGILIQGTSERPVYLHVTENVQELKDATDLWGLGTYETHRKLKEAVKDNLARIACIGPAGENLVKYAMICSGERAAGRTGMGAVMGSKNLKAIVVRGKNRDLNLFSPEEFKKYARKMTKEIEELFMADLFKDLGTSCAVDMYNYRGELPIKYWTQGEFEGAYDISGATMKETILTKNYYCFACPIGCGRIVTVKEGKYKTPENIKGPEYETIAGFGSQICNNDIKAIAKANYLCNDFGIDTISASTVISFLYYLVDKEIISPADLDGITPEWGNPDAALRLIPKIVMREGIGDVLAEGSDAVGKKFSIDSDHIATVYGLEVPYHDLRSSFGMAVAYAAGPRGPCHNALDMYQTSLGQSFPELGIESPDQYDESTTMTDACVRLQDYRSFYSTVVMCVFCNPPPSSIGRLLTLATGFPIGMPEIKEIGERVLNMKRLFNVKMGLKASWDRLPAILTDPLPEGGSAGKSPDWKEMLSQYYNSRKWDPGTGIPAREKLEELGLSFI
jgi:aldehyde:ferredoxin oxidoreductase